MLSDNCVGGAITSHLVRLSTDQAVCVRALAGDIAGCVLGKKISSQSASLRQGVQMGTGKFNAEGNPAMD